MNQKSGLTPLSNRKQEFRIDDIAYSDSDTVPEFSNRDGSNSKEFCHDALHLILVGHIEKTVERAVMSKTSESVASDIKSSKKSFNFFSAPHQASVHLAHSIAKNSADKPCIHIENQFSEPKNDKTVAMTSSELKSLKFDVIVGRGPSFDKSETNEEMIKRLEKSLKEVIGVFPNLVLVCGPIVFDLIFEILTKQKRKPTNKPVVIEQFKRSNREWVRI